MEKNLCTDIKKLSLYYYFFRCSSHFLVGSLLMSMDNYFLIHQKTFQSRANSPKFHLQLDKPRTKALSFTGKFIQEPIISINLNFPAKKICAFCHLIRKCATKGLAVLEFFSKLSFFYESGSFLRRQLSIDNYHVKKYVKESQFLLVSRQKVYKNAKFV